MTLLRQALELDGGGVVSLVGAGGKTTLMFRMARELSEAGETVLTTTTTRILRPGPDESPCVLLSGSPEAFLAEAEKLVGRFRHITAAAPAPEPGKLMGFPPEAVDAIYRRGMFRWILVEADGAARRPIKAPAAHEPVVPASTRWFIAVAGLSALGKPFAEDWVFRHEPFSRVTGLCRGEMVTEEAYILLLCHREGLIKGCSESCRAYAFLNQADTPSYLAGGRRIAEKLAAMAENPFARILVGQARNDPPVLAFYEGKP